VAVMQTSIL